MTDEIPACPDCGSSQIRRRTDRWDQGVEKKWWCQENGCRFDTPTYRERHTGGGRNFGLSSDLLEMDADDVGGRRV